jgi:hypothetical protein
MKYYKETRGDAGGDGVMWKGDGVKWKGGWGSCIHLECRQSSGCEG